MQYTSGWLVDGQGKSGVINKLYKGNCLRKLWESEVTRIREGVMAEVKGRVMAKWWMRARGLGQKGDRYISGIRISRDCSILRSNPYLEALGGSTRNLREMGLSSLQSLWPLVPSPVAIVSPSCLWGSLQLPPSGCKFTRKDQDHTASLWVMPWGSVP